MGRERTGLEGRYSVFVVIGAFGGLRDALFPHSGSVGGRGEGASQGVLMMNELRSVQERDLMGLRE